jgi:hypothetical protein
MIGQIYSGFDFYWLGDSATSYQLGFQDPAMCIRVLLIFVFIYFVLSKKDIVIDSIIETTSNYSDHFSMNGALLIGVSISLNHNNELYIRYLSNEESKNLLFGRYRFFYYDPGLYTLPESFKYKNYYFSRRVKLDPRVIESSEIDPIEFNKLLMFDLFHYSNFIEYLIENNIRDEFYFFTDMSVKGCYSNPIKLNSLQNYKFYSEYKTNRVGFKLYRFTDFIPIIRLKKGYLFQKIDLTFPEPFPYLKKPKKRKRVRFHRSTKK